MFWKRKKQEPEPSIEPLRNDEASQDLPSDDESQIAQTVTPTEAETPIESPPVESLSEPETPKKRGLFGKLFDRLRASRDAILQKTISIFQRRGKIDDELLDELEETLITADIGVETTTRLIDHLRDQVKFQKKKGSTDIDWLTDTLQSAIGEMIASEGRSLRIGAEKPSVYLIVGVNGVGKTTAIGKLAWRFRSEGKKVLIVAADTFRAAAIDQLAIWADRAGCDVVKGDEGADPSSVVYTAVDAARTGQHDVVIIDTAGRLHNRANLMQELGKMARVIGREFPGAPHETLLVLDASTGQNALQQARQFTDICGVTGIILTKMDGTAKGGVIIGIHDQLKIPVKFIGIGEKIDDLEPFDSEAFLKALFEREEV